MIFTLVFAMLLSASSEAAEECDFATEEQKVVEKALSCKIEDTEFQEAKNHAHGLEKIVNGLKIYPVYDHNGFFLKFINFEGHYKKGLVLVLKRTKKVKDESYKDLGDFEVYKSNDFRNDVGCFARQTSAMILDEISIMNCIDQKIEKSLKDYEIEKVRSFSLKKLRMIKIESGASGAFDSGSECGGHQKLTFFNGRVYNRRDMGNFVWGAIMERLKVTDFSKKFGSTLNGYIASARQNEYQDINETLHHHGEDPKRRFLAKTHLLGDSPEDQIAIFEGARWMRATDKILQPYAKDKKK